MIIFSICTQIFRTKEDSNKFGMIDDKNHCDCNPLAEEHIKKWGNFLANQADEIICFAKSSEKIISQFYPLILSKIRVITHDVSY